MTSTSLAAHPSGSGSSDQSHDIVALGPEERAHLRRMTFAQWRGPRTRLDTAFQPIVRLSTGRVYGYEALGRITREGSDVPIAIPALFARAHREGWLLALDRSLRRAALERIAEAPRDPSLRWFLNVDSRGVDDPTFAPGFTRRTLEELGLEDLSVVIELGERDPKLDRDRLARMYPSYARQGFGIALDDFGAGHASLAAVVAVRPDVLKLDGEIICGLATDSLRQSLVRAIARFASDAGILLIAEGIETEADLRAVRESGVDLGQGYLLGRPAQLPREEVLLAVGG